VCSDNKKPVVCVAVMFIKIAKCPIVYEDRSLDRGRDIRESIAIRTSSFGDIIADARRDEERNDDMRPLRFNQRGKLTGCIIRNA